MFPTAIELDPLVYGSYKIVQYIWEPEIIDNPHLNTTIIFIGDVKLMT